MARQLNILLLVALTAACAARVPSQFSVVPPRLAPSDLTIEDLRDADEVDVLVFGDAGTGSRDQREVGRRMSEVCAEVGCDLALMLSGHDHHQEHLVADGFHQIIQGAAGKRRSVGPRSRDYDASQAFAASQCGFAILRIRREAIGVTFYGYEPEQPDTFDAIYESTIAAN